MSKAPIPANKLAESFLKRHGLDMPLKVVGIDPSLSNTAVCVGDGTTWDLDQFPSEPLGQDVRSRTCRYDQLVAGIVKYIESQGPVAGIYIEAYAHSRNLAGKSGTIEFGGILRWHLVDLAPRVFEVAPNTLKKFVTGRGGSDVKKSSMLAHIQKRWDVLFDSDDAGDAFGLYKLGCVVEKIAEAEMEAQREAAATVAGSMSR